MAKPIIDRFLKAFDAKCAEDSLTAKQLTQKLPFSEAFISFLRSGRTKSIRADYVQRFCAVTGTSILWVITGAGDMKDSNEQRSRDEEIRAIKKDIAEIKKHTARLADIQGDIIEKMLDEILKPSMKPTSAIKELAMKGSKKSS
jgi:DNA-binding Xre family transcriptional regulator